MKNTYFTLIALVAFCAGMYQLQAMQQPNEELKLLNASIAKHEAKKDRVGRLAPKDAEQLEADKARRDELERRHGLTSAQAERSRLRETQLQVRRQQEDVELEEPQSELRQQASVQTMQQPGGRQQQVQQQPQWQPRPRVQHQQSEERLQSSVRPDLPAPQDNVSYQSWDEDIQEWINNLSPKDKMKD